MKEYQRHIPVSLKNTCQKFSRLSSFTSQSKTIDIHEYDDNDHNLGSG